MKLIAALPGFPYDAEGPVISLCGTLASVILLLPMTAVQESKDQIVSYDGTISQVKTA